MALPVTLAAEARRVSQLASTAHVTVLDGNYAAAREWLRLLQVEAGKLDAALAAIPSDALSATRPIEVRESR